MPALALSFSLLHATHCRSCCVHRSNAGQKRAVSVETADTAEIAETAYAIRPPVCPTTASLPSPNASHSPPAPLTQWATSTGVAKVALLQLDEQLDQLPGLLKPYVECADGRKVPPQQIGVVFVSNSSFDGRPLPHRKPHTSFPPLRDDAAQTRAPHHRDPSNYNWSGPSDPERLASWPTSSQHHRPKLWSRSPLSAAAHLNRRPVSHHPVTRSTQTPPPDPCVLTLRLPPSS